MKKVNVELVRYDMTKTKNRKRKDFVVDEATEASLIARLEKIHKGEKFVAFHELVWGEEEKIEEKLVEVFTGTVKFFDSVKGFGFIKPDIDDVEDFFFHASALSTEDISDGDPVEYEVGHGPKGPVAIKIKPLE